MISLILSVFILLIFFIVYREYKNEKRYQEERHKRTAEEWKDTTKEKTPKPKSSSSLPKADYPDFTHQRLLEMGLSNDEAKNFVKELIPQLEIQIPLIDETIHQMNFHQMERLTHSIKGSATNIGTGGVADLLIAFNTYLKKGTDINVIQAYFEHLQYYTQLLKKKYL